MCADDSSASTGGLALAIPATLAAEIEREAVARGMKVETAPGVMARLWLRMSRAKREGLERRERVGVGSWLWADGEPIAHEEMLGI